MNTKTCSSSARCTLSSPDCAPVWQSLCWSARFKVQVGYPYNAKHMAFPEQGSCTKLLHEETEQTGLPCARPTTLVSPYNICFEPLNLSDLV